MKTLWCSGVMLVALTVAGAGGNRLEAAGAATAYTWEQVGQAGDDLVFVQRITGYALTCPAADLERRLREKPAGLSEDRGSVAAGVLAEAWLARDRAKALAAWKADRAAWPAVVQGAFFAALAETDAKEAEALLKTLPKGQDYQMGFYAVVQGLVKHDPEAAWALALAETNEEESVNMLSFVLRIMADKDPAGAMKRAAALPEGQARQQGVGIALDQWFSKSPEGALKWADGAALDEDTVDHLAWMYAHYAREQGPEAERLLAGVKNEQLRKALAGRMLSQAEPAQLWSRVASSGWEAIPKYSLDGMIDYAGTQKPAEAARLFKSIPAERLKDRDSVVKLTQAWAWLDGGAAQAWAEALPEGAAREAAILRMNTMWAMIDPKRALAQIEATPPGGLKAQLVRNVAVYLAKENPAAAIEWINTQTDPAGRERALSSLAEMGADRNPEETAGLLGKLNPGAARVKVYEQFSRSLAQTDPEGALDWFLTLPAGAERTALSKRIMGEVAEKVPEYAAAMIGDVTDPAEKTKLVTALMDTYVPVNPGALPGLLEAIPKGAARNQALSKALGAIAERDPAMAVQYFQGSELGAQKGDAIQAIGRSWASKDPESAARWVEGFVGEKTVTGYGVSSAVAVVARSWASVDVPSALAWVAKLPAGTIRQTATSQVVYGVMETYPERAFDAVLTEPGLAKKGQLIETVMKQWNAVDPVTAARRVQASTLPDAVKTHLLNLKK